MQLRHPNRPRDLNLVLTRPDQSGTCHLFLLFNSLTTWKTKIKALPSLSIYPSKGWKGRGLWCPFQSRIRASQSWANMFFFSCLFSFMVRYSGILGVEEPHQSIPNLVVKLYCSDDTVGEVLRKNSSTPECELNTSYLTFSLFWNTKETKEIQNAKVVLFKTSIRESLPLHIPERTFFL